MNNEIIPSDSAQLAFTPEEQGQIEQLKRQLDLSDSVTAVEYGIGCQRQLAGFADRVLDNSTQSAADTGALLERLLDEIHLLDPGMVFGNDFWSEIPFFGSKTRRMKKLKKRFQKSKIRIERLETELERSRMELLKGSELFDMLGKENIKCYREISVYIAAGRQQLDYLTTQVVPSLAAEAEKSGDPMALQQVFGFKENLAGFDSRLNELELSRTIALQSAPQLKLIQSGNSVMAQKIQSAVLGTIPVWKNQFAAAVGLADQTNFCKVQKKLEKTTNTMVRRNAEFLQQSAAQTAAAAGRSFVDTTALQKANDSLIKVIEETLTLNRESSQRHKQAESELVRIENNLKNTLSRIN